MPQKHKKKNAVASEKMSFTSQKIKNTTLSLKKGLIGFFPFFAKFCKNSHFDVLRLIFDAN